MTVLSVDGIPFTINVPVSNCRVDEERVVPPINGAGPDCDCCNIVSMLAATDCTCAVVRLLVWRPVRYAARQLDTVGRPLGEGAQVVEEVKAWLWAVRSAEASVAVEYHGWPMVAVMA